MSFVWWCCSFRAQNHIYSTLNGIFWGGVVTVIVCVFEWTRERFMPGLENISAICSTCLFAPPSELRHLMKFIFDLLNGSHESDGEQQGETKEEKTRQTPTSGSSLISASGSTESCAGPLCFQMLHRLVPSLYNCYVTYADDSNAFAFWKNMIWCAHIYNPLTFIK